MPSKNRRGLRTILWLSVVIVVLAVGLGLWLWSAVRASLPQLDGSARLAGLEADVIVERDDLGVPTIRAHNRLDAARATGFIHAQDRFFQMDMLRRTGAGELSELFGVGTLEADRYLRVHRLRATAGESLGLLPEWQKELLQAYTEGVNAGLEALECKPPEYLVLRCSPRLWAPEDTILASYTMFFGLQDETARYDSTVGLLAEVLPPGLLAFFLPDGNDWDSAIDGSRLPIPAIPELEGFSFDLLPDELSSRRTIPRGLSVIEPSPVGSNSWALDGRLSDSGSALIANDMHLALGMPNTWYRLRILCQGPEEASPSLDITGVSLPGTPAVVVGSNTHIAWAFTNSMLDTADLVVLEFAPDDPKRYLTPDGWATLDEHQEVLNVRGARNETLTVETTIWGPVVNGADESSRHAVRWVAHFPEAVNLSIMGLEQIQTAEEALRLAPECGIPVQNFVVGDRSGRIGWTLMGRLPRRIGLSGRFPASWADGAARWDGWLSAEEYPVVFDPPGGRLWTANNRVAGFERYLEAGPWLTDLGARARQIRDDLEALDSAGPEDMLAIQLDDRALFLDRWRELLLSTLSLPALSRAETTEMEKLVRDWGGRASVDSVGYRLVRGFRSSTLELLLEPITERCRAIRPEFRHSSPLVEQPAWTLLTERPRHLLNGHFQDYDQLLVAAVESMLKSLSEQGLKPGQARWGDRNRVAIRHPLSNGLPLFGRWFDIPAQPLPGDSHMPRVQGTADGASQRLAVSPGHEDEGIFHMPGGQSGHFLSPYYRAGHEAWANGDPTPFLPGEPRHRLTLSP
jgi:penicillin G amidase